MAPVAGTSEAELVGGPRITEDGMRELISSCDPASKLLLAAVEADDDRAVLGSLLLEKRGDECHLGLLSVDPRLQNRGIGRKLLAAGQQHGKDVFGCSYAGMKVVESRTELIQWYQRQGFELTDEREDFNYSLAVLLQGPLTFVGMRRPL